MKCPSCGTSLGNSGSELNHITKTAMKGNDKIKNLKAARIRPDVEKKTGITRYGRSASD